MDDTLLLHMAGPTNDTDETEQQRCCVCQMTLKPICKDRPWPEGSIIVKIEGGGYMDVTEWPWEKIHNQMKQITEKKPKKKRKRSKSNHIVLP